MYDVVQIGYGPVGQSLALMLGRQGRSMAVIERWRKRHALPRAVCLDHEPKRFDANAFKRRLRRAHG